VTALAHAQGLLEQRVQRRSDCAVVLAPLQGPTHLSEDLRLTHEHGVQAGRHGEEVRDRGVVVVDVQVLDGFVAMQTSV